jgi:hypothetical protein
MSRASDGFEFHRSVMQRLLAAVYSGINRIVPWHRLPRFLGFINLAVYRDRLRENNLHHTGYGVSASDPWVAGYERWRSADGAFNDLDHPRMGMAGARFGRNVPLAEAVPEPESALLDPNPRIISRELLARRTFIPATTLNLLAAAWIQFEIGDWFGHGSRVMRHDPFRIPLPPGDDWADAKGGCMHMWRTQPDTTAREPWLGATPTRRNSNSHWWDAAQLYGSSKARQDEIRSARDGMIKVDTNGMLPEDPGRPGADLTGFNDSWWVGLSLLHTLFAREHNAIGAALKGRHPTWDDEELFQRARLINAAVIAKIHTLEWTPGILAHPAIRIGAQANWSGLPSRVLRAVLGKNSEAACGIMGSPTRHFGAPYAITEEFVSVYRLHPLLPDELRVHQLDGEAGETIDFLHLQGSFTRPLMQKFGFTSLLYSLGIAHPGAITIQNYPNFLRQLETDDPRETLLLDVAAIDIMRDRERGVPRYNRFRELIGRPRAAAFEDITSIPGIAAKMREIYKADIDRVDLLVGLLSEDLPEGFGFSDTAFRLFILMASRRLKSDRFFTDDFRPEIYSELGMDWIRNASMKSVLLRHAPDLGPALEGVANCFAPWNALPKEVGDGDRNQNSRAAQSRVGHGAGGDLGAQ